MSEQIKCDSDCRDDLIKRIGCPVQRQSVWKFVTFLVAVFGIVWGIAYGVYSAGVSDRIKLIEKNEHKSERNAQIINQALIDLSAIRSQLQHILSSQMAIEKHISELQQRK